MISLAVLAAAVALGSSGDAEVGKRWPLWAEQMFVAQCEDDGALWGKRDYCGCLATTVEGTLSPQQALDLNTVILSSKLGAKHNGKQRKLIGAVVLACGN